MSPSILTTVISKAVKSTINLELYQEDPWKYWLSRLVRTGERLNIMPFAYDKERQIIKIGSVKARILLYTIVALSFVDVAYLFSVCKKVTVQSTSTTEFTDFMNHFVSRTFAALVMPITILKLKETVQFANALIFMRKEMRGNHLHFNSKLLIVCAFNDFFCNL